jgi:hypothetical protein
MLKCIQCTWSAPLAAVSHGVPASSSRQLQKAGTHHVHSMLHITIPEESNVACLSPRCSSDKEPQTTPTMSQRLRCYSARLAAVWIKRLVAFCLYCAPARTFGLFPFDCLQHSKFLSLVPSSPPTARRTTIGRYHHGNTIKSEAPSAADSRCVCERCPLACRMQTRLRELL